MKHAGAWVSQATPAARGAAGHFRAPDAAGQAGTVISAGPGETGQTGPSRAVIYEIRCTTPRIDQLRNRLAGEDATD